MRNLIVTFFLFVCMIPVDAQTDSGRHKVYQVYKKIELPASVAGIGLSTLGFRKLEQVSAMSVNDVLKLDPSTINAFDRPDAFLDPRGFENAERNSNLFLNISLISPLLLGLDKTIRKDWLDLFSLYLVTHAADNAVYFAGAYAVRRPRPLTYNPNISIAGKTGEGRSNSFFSGHVSFSAAATFFAAKIYTDYHRITGWKRVLIYSIASVPPALVGYYRIRAGKHFRTDVLLGFLAGASSGILIPELHRIRNKKSGLTVNPYYSDAGAGITAALRF